MISVQREVGDGKEGDRQNNSSMDCQTQIQCDCEHKCNLRVKTQLGLISVLIPFVFVHIVLTPI